MRAPHARHLPESKRSVTTSSYDTGQWVFLLLSAGGLSGLWGLLLDGG
ncbi:MAG: hypothetical protein LBG69_07780 [Zoogloeaceae bacterium]|nr:hypothetical protein [Zoogloeaceae bacterium]